MRLPMIGGEYTARSTNAAAQRCVNLYTDAYEAGTDREGEKGYLRGTPGLALLATLGAGPIRGVYMASNGDTYIASGPTMYYVQAGLDFSSVYALAGTLTGGASPVVMADNGTHLVAVTGTAGYSVVLASHLVLDILPIAEGFYGAAFVSFLNGFFIVERPGTGQFNISELYSLTFDALEFATAETDPDPILAHIVVRKELWLFGPRSSEVWFLSDDADFPIAPISGASSDYGIMAPYSLAKADASLYFLSQDEAGVGIVMKTNGYQPVRVSTSAIEQRISKFTNPSDCRGFVHQIDGHVFYVMNFTTDNVTLCYDASTGFWHERAYGEGGVLNRHRAECGAVFNRAFIVGDYENGRVYRLDQDVYTDNGVLIPRIRAIPSVGSDRAMLAYSSVEVDAEMGVGLESAVPGAEPPKVGMRISDDGGKTWTTKQEASLGRIGEYRMRAVFRRLGPSFYRIFEFSVMEPVKVTLLGISARVRQGV